jgi:septation ring formation regulator EzrA
MSTTDAKIVDEPELKPAWGPERTSADRADEVMRRVKAASAGDMAAEAREFRLNFLALYDVIASLQGANNSLAERSSIDRAELEKANQTSAAFKAVHDSIVKDYRIKVSDLGRKVDRYKMRCVGLTMALKAGWSLKLPSEW